MFSPSLVSMMVQSFEPLLWPKDNRQNREESTTLSYGQSWDIPAALVDRVARLQTPLWPRLPIVGRAAFPLNFDVWFGTHVTVDSRDDVTFFWGRVPLDLLVRHLREFHHTPADSHYVDLGTTIRAAGSGSGFDSRCDTYLKQSAPSPAHARIGVGLVDLGRVSPNQPDTYGGRLRHAVQPGELHDHAKKVLSVLLKRLGSKELLVDTTVSCALVLPPTPMVAVDKDCFAQASSVELLEALNKLDSLLSADALPAVVNISLGTHVGPHSGDSPVEEYISRAMVRPHNRFVVASAGNDGGSGVAAKRALVANQRDFLNLKTSPNCQDLLVEFWWDDPKAAGLTIDAEIYGSRPVTGSRPFYGVVKIRPGLTGSLLKMFPAGLGNMTALSLFEPRCRGNLSCIAFAMSGINQPLPAVEVTFGLESPADIVVNAWIIVADTQQQTTFVEGGAEGTVRVPACAPRVLSVAGVESSGQMWDQSSRGPSGQYNVPIATSAPIMAHLVTLGAESGTSYSAPRASADVAVALADSGKLDRCFDVTDLLCEAYGLVRSGLPAWNPRYGFHKVVA